MLSKLRGRSYQELAFRLRQEVSNFILYLRPPQVAAITPPTPLAGLPASGDTVSRLRAQSAAFTRQVEELAQQILAHRFPLLGLTVETGPEIDWSKDYISGKTSATGYFRHLAHADFEVFGDHKNVWELNRHQHLVLLVQSFLLTGTRRYLEEVFVELDSWMEANPYGRGINWASALEVAFRALSWIWIWHLAGKEMPESLRMPFLTALYRHGCYLEHNLSVYFAPNTHLLGEAVALHALGVLFPDWERAEVWKSTGAETVEQHMARRVFPDGAYYEQTTYYHVYATDMFLFHQVLNPGTSPEYRSRVKRMAGYLNALLGPEREISLVGDDDGGRFFHPYGDKLRYGRATLATASVLLHQDYCYDECDLHEQAWWWLGVTRKPCEAGPFDGKALFADTGMVSWVRGQTHVLFKYGPMAGLNAGHSHADLLSLTVRNGEEELLIDPGTYTYVADPEWREWFRGTPAHNTVVIDGMDQAVSKGPFLWVDKPRALLESENPLVANCRYQGITHRRRLDWIDQGLLRIVDEIEGPPGEHEVTQHWHTGVAITMLEPACFRLGVRTKLWANPETSREFGEGGTLGWRSRAFAVKQASPVLKVSRRGGLPLRLVAVLDIDGKYRQWQTAWLG